MRLSSLVLVNIFRNKIRTLLTFGSVTVALFLYSALGGILDTLEESIKVGSETRLVTRNAVSLVFPMPQSYQERIAGVPGVKAVSIQNWFGGQDPADPRRCEAAETHPRRDMLRSSASPVLRLRGRQPDRRDT